MQYPKEIPLPENRYPLTLNSPGSVFSAGLACGAWNDPEQILSLTFLQIFSSKMRSQDKSYRDHACSPLS